MTAKYITTTLPYINSSPHIGHAFEFVLADVIAGFYRSVGLEVMFNTGIDEHGQKVFLKSQQERLEPIVYCDKLAEEWREFCDLLKIQYDNFYRTTSPTHEKNTLRFFEEIKQHCFTKKYVGNYCIGCEAFITDTAAVNGRCPVHFTELIKSEEENIFFDIRKFTGQIEDRLIDKSLSNELQKLLAEIDDLSITRKNVQWGIPVGNGDTFYVWFEALLNYIFAIKYYEDHSYFDRFWKDSLIICGKDNLKFQACILQALLLANGIPQTKEILVHGLILDELGRKMSKTTGNEINPVEQIRKYGVDAVRYYLLFGLNTFSDSKYAEQDLIQLWNNEVVNGLGNLTARLLHLITLYPDIDKRYCSAATHQAIADRDAAIGVAFSTYNFKELHHILNTVVANANKRITEEKPFEKTCQNRAQILSEIYFEVLAVVPIYCIVLRNFAPALTEAYTERKKVIVFPKIGEKQTA